MLIFTFSLKHIHNSEVLGGKNPRCNLQVFFKVIFSTSEATKTIILQQKKYGRNGKWK